MIWYRDDYEKGLILDMNLHVDNVRLQHSFGLESLKVLHLQSSISQYDVAVCFIQFYYLCTISNRNSEIPSSSTYVLLLLGGTWDQWLSNDIITYEHLRHTVHVSEGRVGRAVELIANAKHGIYIFHDDNPISTVSNVLFPLVIAAQRTYYEKNKSDRIHVHLVRGNSHLMKVIESGCEVWDHDYFDSQVSIGLTVAHSLGVTSSRFTLNYIDPLINKHDNDDDSDDSDNQLSVTFNIIYHDFILGRDGSLCVIYMNERVAC